MAQELSGSGAMTFAKGTSRAAITGSIRADVAGTQYAQKTQIIGTVEETVDKGDIGTIGWAMFKNLDAENYVEIGSSAGVYALKVLAGEIAGPMRWNGANVLAKANANPVTIEYLLVEA